MGSVLVVGGTGILAPAVTDLVSGGARVDVLSRSGTAPAGTRGLRADARDADALDAALGAGSWEEAVVYSPTVTDATLDIIRSRVSGRCVVVRTSAAVAPEHGDAAVPPDTLQLGWVAPVAGRPSRWHTPEEVSRAALEILGDGHSWVLGAIRPWCDRPV